MARHKTNGSTMCTTTMLKPQVQVSMTRFNDHIVSAVADTMWTGYATDCILRSKDKIFNCHRFILSMASPFFTQMFETVSPSRLPQLILPDVSSDVVQMIINIIYQGETVVPTELRKEFMEVCSLLQLKGTEEFYEDMSNPFAEPFVSTVEKINPDEMDDSQDDITDDPIDQDDQFEDDSDDDVKPLNFEMVETEPLGKQPSLGTTSPRSRMFNVKYSTNVNIVPTNATTYGKTQRITLRTDEIETVFNRLGKICRRAFTRNLINGNQYEHVEFKTEMHMNQNLLLYGKVPCLVCGKQIIIPYRQTVTGEFRQWCPAMLLNHLKFVHKDLHK